MFNNMYSELEEMANDNIIDPFVEVEARKLSAELAVQIVKVYCEAPSALISDLRQFRAIRRLVIPPLSNGLEQQLQFYDDADEDEDDEHCLILMTGPQGKIERNN